MAQPTAYEQYLLELVNRARLDPSGEAARMGISLNDGLAAGTISVAPKQPLVFNFALLNAAEAHSAWMLANDTFSHTGFNGRSPGDRMQAAGFYFAGDWTWGENISISHGGSGAITQAAINDFHSSLFKSPDHRVNIEKDAFRMIGIGVQSGEYKGSNALTVTEDFARTSSLTFLTGVAFKDADGDHFYDPGEGLGGVHVQARMGSGIPYQTDTRDAGGYQMQVAPGTYQLTFWGGGLANLVTRTITVGSLYVKSDLELSSPSPLSSLPPAKYSMGGVTWGPAPSSVQVGPHDFDGTDYASSVVTDGWNTVKGVSVILAAWSPDFAPKLAFANFVEANLDLHVAGNAALSTLLVGEKRGIVITADNSDNVTWVAHSNMFGAANNTMSISTGSGDDTVLVTTAANSLLDDGIGHGSQWNATYDGRYSIASVSAGSGNDTITAQGALTLNANGGAGADVVRGAAGIDLIAGGLGDDTLAGGAAEDAFAFGRGDGNDTVLDFTSGVDHLRFQGITRAEISTIANGSSGLLVIYDATGDTVFLAGVGKLLASDMIFG